MFGNIDVERNRAVGLNSGVGIVRQLFNVISEGFNLRVRHVFFDDLILDLCADVYGMGILPPVVQRAAWRLMMVFRT